MFNPKVNLQRRYKVRWAGACSGAGRDGADALAACFCLQRYGVLCVIAWSLLNAPEAQYNMGCDGFPLPPLDSIGRLPSTL